MSFKIFNKPDYFVIKAESNVDNELLSQRTESFEDFRVTDLLGFAITESDFLSDATTTTVDVSLPELALAHGEWTAVAARDGEAGPEYLFLADRFGYSPVFYSLADPNNIVVSNSFQGVVLGMRNLDVELTLNLPYYSTLISSNSPTFQNSHLHATMANEIRLLSSDNMLFVCDEGVSFVDRDLPGGLSNLNDYSNAIQQGIDHISNVFNTMGRNAELNARITLTGGVDSRLCLSLASLSDSFDRLTVSTIDPRRWSGRKGQRTINRDMVISNRIRKDYNLEWWEQPNRRKVSTDFVESLAAFQSYRSNFSYTFMPSAAHTRYAESVMTVRGGGGEILRVDASIEKIARKYEEYKESQPENVMDEAKWYAEYVLSGSLLDGLLAEEAKDLIVSEYPEGYGESFLERISYLYLSHRYRGHFGHQRQTTSTNDIILHPLSNSYLLRAARLITFEELVQGKMVKDLFHRSNPALLDYTFASDDWSVRLTGQTGPESEYESLEWIPDYSNVPRGSKSEFDKGRGPKKQSSNPGIDYIELSMQYLTTAFGTLERYMPTSLLNDMSSLHRAVLNRVSAGKFIPGYAVAKAASAIDVFFPRANTGNPRYLKCRTKPSSGAIPTSDTSSFSIQRDEFKDLDFPSGQLRIEQEENILIATLHGFLSNSNLNEFAFYTYKNSERIATQWYSDKPYTVIWNPDHDAEYSVQVFVRSAESKRMIGKCIQQVRIP
ncbi:hypothetical protein [Glutamicibacter arilaitensis]|uniref:Asparagine synthetase domain-containing protein n=1 Tax=Glutamicibacter arilaitensis TaxID=256701 RepID=A0A4Y8TYY3_9MICC|nr:hypothetical protein [Glutamicibacter arilaitensis]TFH57415.1 hypothetical protein EXY26_10635 [Glutamicibacter arilaitensis]